MSLFRNIVWSPSDYAQAAVVAEEVGAEMLDRLDFMMITPKVILDIGCGTGATSVLLKKRYPEAEVIAIDLAELMLAQVAQDPKITCIQADTRALPFKAQSVDIIFANFLMPWIDDTKSLLKEWHRLLRPDGLLMFSALGPDTLREWRHEMQNEHIPLFVDMHDFGDVMLHEGYSDPVVDVNYFTTTYRDKNKFLHEITASGMWFPEKAHDDFAPSAEGLWEATFEVVYAHAFAPTESNEHGASADGIVRVPLSALRKQLSGK